MFMSEKLLAFFDWRGGVSRIQYLRGLAIRSLILFVIILLNYFLSFLFGWDVGSDLIDEGEGYLEYLGDPLVSASASIIFLPWDLRRMKDAGIKWWWLVVFEILLRLPEPPEIDGGDFIAQNAAYLCVSTIPYFIFSLMLLLKPGQIHKDFLRNGPARRGRNKVTFSE